MTIIHTYPTTADRKKVHEFIQLYAHGKLKRNTLMYAIAGIIKKYPNLNRIPVFGYSVRILQYYKNLPIISIEGAELSDSCPCCQAGTEDAAYLRTEKENFGKNYDLVSVTCLECGCVYQVYGLNGRPGGEEHVGD